MLLDILSITARRALVGVKILETVTVDPAREGHNDLGPKRAGTQGTSCLNLIFASDPMQLVEFHLPYPLVSYLRYFPPSNGVVSWVCLKCHNIPRVASLHAWKSLHFCYSWILLSDYRKTAMPYLDQFKLDMKYGVFHVASMMLLHIRSNFMRIGMTSNEEEGGEKFTIWTTACFMCLYMLVE